MAFQKGQSGNPGGRGTEKPFHDALRMELAAAGKDGKKLRAIARKLLDEAEDGNMKAIKEVADRLDGRPAQALEHTGRDGGPIETDDINGTELARRIAFLLAGAIDKPDDT